MTVEELRLILRINGTTTYTHALNEVTNVTNNYTNSIGSLTSTLAKFVSAGFIAKFAKDCIEAASNLQEVSNVMNVTFGQNAQIIDQWAKTQAASFGLSEKAAKDYTGLYGTMAKQFGVSLDRATAMSIELTKLTGDVASFYNTTDKIASNKLKSIFTGETESLKELGVVMTEANLNAYALEKGFGKTVKQMSEQEKVMLRYSFVMDKLQHTQGDFARTSDGWANSVRLLKLNLENLRVEIGNQLLPVAGQGLAAINGAIKAIAPTLIAVAQTVRLFGEAWKNASSTTKNFAKIALGAIAVGAIAPKVITTVSKAIKLLTVDTVTLGGAIATVTGIIGLLFAALAFADLAKSVKEMKESTENIADIGTSAEVSTGAVDSLSDAMNNLGDSAQGLNTFLASFDEVNKVGGGGSLMSSLVSADDLSNIIAAASGIEDLNSMMSEISDSVSNLNLGDISKDTFMDPEWWKKKWNGLKGFFKTFFNGEWKENWTLGIEMIGGWFEENFPKWTAFWELFGEGWANTFEPVKKVLREISDIMEGLWQKFEDSKWSNFWEGVGEKIYDKHYEDITSRGSGHQRYADSSTESLASGYAGSNSSTVSNVTNNSAPTTVQFTPTIQIDSKKITSAVIEGINAITVSAGKSPLIE